jgi:hypothetical protein
LSGPSPKLHSCYYHGQSDSTKLIPFCGLGENDFKLKLSSWLSKRRRDAILYYLLLYVVTLFG